MKKLDANQMKDYVAEALRKAILSGLFQEGKEITQQEVACLLEVSRMPVREAFQILELEGLLCRLKNRRVSVVGPNRKRVQEVMGVVAVFEMELCALWVQNQLSLQCLDEALHRFILCQMTDYSGVYAFHRCLSSEMDNAYVHQVHLNLLKGYPAYVFQYAYASLDASRVAGHLKNIIGAMAHEDPLKASETIRIYFTELAEAMIHYIERSEYDDNAKTD